MSTLLAACGYRCVRVCSTRGFCFCFYFLFVCLFGLRNKRNCPLPSIDIFTTTTFLPYLIPIITFIFSFYFSISLFSCILPIRHLQKIPLLTKFSTNVTRAGIEAMISNIGNVFSYYFNRLVLIIET